MKKTRRNEQELFETFRRVIDYARTCYKNGYEITWSRAFRKVGFVHGKVSNLPKLCDVVRLELSQRNLREMFDVVMGHQHQMSRIHNLTYIPKPRTVVKNLFGDEYKQPDIFDETEDITTEEPTEYTAETESQDALDLIENIIRLKKRMEDELQRMMFDYVQKVIKDKADENPQLSVAVAENFIKKLIK